MDIGTIFQQLGIESDERFFCLAPGMCYLIDEFKLGRSKSKKSTDLIKYLLSIVNDYKKFDSSVSKAFAINKAIKCGESWNVFDSETINTAVAICELSIEVGNFIDKNPLVEINVIRCENDMPDELKDLLRRHKSEPVSDAARKFRMAKVDPNKIM